MSWTIREAASDDRDAIVAMVRDAFSDATRDGHEEVDIVRARGRAARPPMGSTLSRSTTTR